MNSRVATMPKKIDSSKSCDNHIVNRKANKKNKVAQHFRCADINAYNVIFCYLSLPLNSLYCIRMFVEYVSMVFPETICSWRVRV